MKAKMNISEALELISKTKDITSREVQYKNEIQSSIKDLFHKKEVSKLENEMENILNMYFEMKQENEKLKKEIEDLKSEKEEIHSDYVLQKAVNEGRTSYPGYSAFA